MATSAATPDHTPDDPADPAVDPVAAAISAVIDPLIVNEKVIAAGYAERSRLLTELDRLGHEPRILAGLCGDPVESGRNDPDTGAHGPAWDDEELARRSMAAEAAGALRLTATTAGMMIFDAARLTGQLPGFHQALSRGSITWGHAVKMLTLTDGVPEEILPDAYRDLLLDGVGPSGLGHGIRGTVSITVPALTLLGRSDEPAILDGYGPIDPETARRIAGTATSWSRILTHPETGCRLSMGRDTYNPPADMRRYLDARDQTCQGIGCNRRATLSDIDHTRPWCTGGPTDVDNLVHLCRACHRLKHQSSFPTRQGPGGALTWTTPAGKTYTSAPTNTDPTTYDPASYVTARHDSRTPRLGIDGPPPF
ncbi:HNH endonuclease signature motif containing protein [Cryobacterium sp. TMB1-7]|uniref:HNH endonuclease signature motif containing protein n=4 Tax=Cryobacterium TaxID=69578 RepID=UPI00106C39CC|nr:HNH endonuclease signature motif containing protein [Cryobacterium sp. TMB1-7]TFC57660.1 HNH endonuclease [Cryobacterium sp. TMB1-7]